MFNAPGAPFPEDGAGSRRQCGGGAVGGGGIAEPEQRLGAPPVATVLGVAFVVSPEPVGTRLRPSGDLLARTE